MSKNFDFEKDLKKIMINQFNRIGVSYSKNKGIDSLLLDYLTLEKKLVHPVKREVLINPEFVSKIDKHQKRKEITAIINSLKTGGNVNIFQHNKVYQTGYHDFLMYNWNIYHFHLSTKINPKTGFVKGTNEILFVYIYDRQAIVLGTDRHNDTAFGDIKWLEILHDHFSKEIEMYKPSDLTDINPTLDSKGRQEVWKRGYSTGFEKVRGVIYAAPGLGIMTSGHSQMVVHKKITTQKWLHIAEEQFKNESGYLSVYYKHPLNPVLKRDTIYNTLMIIDKETGTEYLAYNRYFSMDEIKKELMLR